MLPRWTLPSRCGPLVETYSILVDLTISLATIKSATASDFKLMAPVACWSQYIPVMCKTDGCTRLKASVQAIDIMHVDA